MSKFTDELLQKHNVPADGIHLPAGGVAIFGRTGTGKSTALASSRFVGRVLIADTGSMFHRMWAGDRAVVIRATGPKSPIEQVREEVDACDRAGTLYLLDSWSTLQEQQVLWFKANRQVKFGVLSIPQHGEIVGWLRDLALILAQTQGFTIFNTTAGGQGKAPSGDVIHYPAGALTGYQSLNGTEPNKETILARWGSVWGMFQGYAPKELPRGLYVPSKDIRPEGHEKYAPLKDPYGVLRDTSGKGIMEVPNREDPANVGRCFVDELLVEIAARYPKARPAAAAQPAPGGREGRGGK